MPLETWGTFSVADHQRPRAFVAEVLLYDRLVVPVPPEGDDEGWAERGWNPEELKTALSIIGNDLARGVPWGPDQRRAFKARAAAEQSRATAAARLQFAEEVGFDAANMTDQLSATQKVDPLFVTRLVLVDHANERRDRAFFEEHPEVYVEPVAAYPSAEAFTAEVPIETIQRGEPSAGPLATIFGWEFVVPDDDKASDEDLLAEAVEIARRDSFRKARAEFHEWRREIARHGVSPATALADMEQRLERYREETSTTNTRTRVMNGFAVAGIGASFAAAFVFPPAGVAGAFLAAARLGAERLLPSRPADRYAAPAAMFHDARKQFGWGRTYNTGTSRQRPNQPLDPT